MKSNENNTVVNFCGEEEEGFCRTRKRISESFLELFGEGFCVVVKKQPKSDGQPKDAAGFERFEAQ